MNVPQCGGPAPDGRADRIGSKVGHIRITGRLGAGGMGVVYAGFDETLRRKVALKAIAGHHRMSAPAQARFVREARSLSRLDHPNICRIYDFIEAEDGDYLVLELIDGRDLGLAIAKGLEHRKKLKIARDIAAVLAAAHDEGIIHRDLKPGNVMLTAAGEVKVLDFGLARSESDSPSLPEDPPPEQPPRAPAADELGDSTLATLADTDATLVTAADTTGPMLPDPPEDSEATSVQTRHGMVVGTPRFMSPEQARGETLTTASDMYSFGLLVQSMFTGRLPYPRGLGRHEILERAKRAETLPITDVDGDLARLVGRLKSPSPATRPTAATTLERLEWILAKPARRIRRLTVAAVILIATIAGVKYTIDLGRERNIAVQAREVAELRRGQAENLIGFMLGDLRQKLEPVGRLDILDDVGQQAMDYFAAVPEEELSDEELLNRSKTLYQIGEVRIAQGDLAAAAQVLSKSLLLAEALSARDPSDGERLFGVGQSHFWVGYVHWLQGDLDKTLREYRRYLDVANSLIDMDPSNLDWLLEVAYAHTNIGAVYEKQGNLAQALAAIERSNAIKRRLVDSSPGRADWSRSLANGLSWLGTTLLNSRKLDESLAAFQEELAIRQRLLEADPRNSDSAFLTAVGFEHVGGLHLITGDPEEALRHYRQAIERLKVLVSLDDENTYWHRELAVAHRLAGDALIEIDRVDLAREDYVLSTSMLRKLSNDDRTNADWRRELAQAMVGLARVELSQDRAARDPAMAAIALLASTGNDDKHARQTLAEAFLLLGTVDHQAGRHEQAKEAWLNAITATQPLGEAGESLRALDYRVQALLHMERREEARPLIGTLADIGYARPGFIDYCAKAGSTIAALCSR